jgi:hypothetical protein
MTRRHRLLTALAAVLASLTFAGPAAAAFAPAATAPVHPGVMTYTAGAQCTSNFVFTDATSVYLGQAAHCSGTGGSTETNGCEAASLPIGTPVEVRGASKPGTLVYNSWRTMQADGEADPDTCQYNDFALVKLDPADADRTNPSIPFWGGPTGLNTTGTTTGAKVLSYGNSSLRLGVSQLSPKEGVSLGNTDNGGWTHSVYTVSPGIPGDSGSAFFNKGGKAFGVLSVLEALPRPASNGVADLSRAMAYMQANGGPQVSLANGTEAFRGPIVPVP